MKIDCEGKKKRRRKKMGGAVDKGNELIHKSIL